MAVTFTNGPTRVALYLRAETLTQATRQAALLHHLADREPGWRVVAVFGDLTSGEDRPGRDAAMSTAKTGLDVLLVMSLDRLTRDTDELSTLIGQLTAADVTLCTEHRPHGPQGQAEIIAVDTFLAAVYDELAVALRPVRELPAATEPAGGAQ